VTVLAPTDADSFEARAARRLRAEPPGILEALTDPNGDHALERTLPENATARPKPAAVLVPVVMHEEEATILFTERATHLRDHSGQIALPGGKIDPDETPRETALREAEEEIGLDRALVRPVGYLDTYLASSGFIVFPVVGLVTPQFTLTLNTHEVADAFEVPLSFLMEPRNHEIHAREWKGRIRQYYAMSFGERYIWGVTAGILRNLYVRLYES
jgi:8-oxo-dGTP pyrophosphatase MutT (NUDIX family)